MPENTIKEAAVVAVDQWNSVCNAAHLVRVNGCGIDSLNL